MIWKSVLNGYPEVDCKCEVLIERTNGDIEDFFCDYDALMGMFLIPAITEELQGQHVVVLYWRAL